MPLTVLTLLAGCGVLVSGTIPTSRLKCNVAETLAHWPNWWPNAARNINGSRWNPNSQISPSNVANLQQSFEINIGASVSATPAYFAGRLFFPDFNGNFWCLNSTDGSTIWTKSGFPVSRSTPNVAQDLVIFGTQGYGNPANGGSQLIALDTMTGTLKWTKTLNNHPWGSVTQSGTRVCDILYIGSSSLEEGAGASCCTFQGQFFAIDLAANGAILWHANMTQDGYPGVSVWGSSPAVSLTHGMVYITTGDVYLMPASYDTCLSGGKTPAQCLPAGVLGDAIVALDLYNGTIKWSFRNWLGDAWNGNCYGQSGCPTNPRPLDYDFAQGPMLFNTPSGKELVGAGNKGGYFYALNRTSGKLVWATRVGPGGTMGGLEWGSATDNNRIYVSLSNSLFVNFQLPDATFICYGAFAALDAECGTIVWMTPDPSGSTMDPTTCPTVQKSGGLFGSPTTIPVAMGPVTLADGVVFGSSLNGYMYAFSSSTGKLLWQFHKDGDAASYNTAPAIVGNSIYFGTGYTLGGLPVFKQGTKFYGFHV